MQSLTAVVLGATGFIGEQLVQQLLNDDAFSKVRILIRRPVNLSHPKIEAQIVNFDNLSDYRSKLGSGECIFCCIGTTQKKVKGDKNRYRKIDMDIAFNAAQIGKDSGFTHYLLVSSVGANVDSSNFYFRLKGEIEKKIATLNFVGFHAFRPGILLGERKEFRLGVIAGKNAIQRISGLFLGKLRKYRGIKAADVAKAMVAASKSGEKRMFIHHYENMIKLEK